MGTREGVPLFQAGCQFPATGAEFTYRRQCSRENAGRRLQIANAETNCHLHPAVKAVFSSFLVKRTAGHKSQNAQGLIPRTVDRFVQGLRVPERSQTKPNRLSILKSGIYAKKLENEAKWLKLWSMSHLEPETEQFSGNLNASWFFPNNEMSRSKTAPFNSDPRESPL
jgi:hypothetical protein